MGWYYIKWLHVAAASLSLTGFVVRGVWMLAAPHRLERRWVRRAPHWVDTVLLASGVAMALHYGWTPANAPWLGAKLLALAGYIVLGALALRHAPTRRLRIAAWLAALALFAYILSVATAKTPLPWA